MSGAPPSASNRLYKNNRDGAFSDVTEKAGLQFLGWGSGVCVGDYNNDGWEDLCCTFYGRNRLYRNNGDGTFTDVTKEAGLGNSTTRWGAGCTVFDHNRDSQHHLFGSNYVQFDPAHIPKTGQVAYCTCHEKKIRGRSEPALAAHL
jgi:hypothetical protein